MLYYLSRRLQDGGRFGNDWLFPLVLWVKDAFLVIFEAFSTKKLKRPSGNFEKAEVPSDIFSDRLVIEGARPTLFYKV